MSHEKRSTTDHSRLSDYDFKLLIVGGTLTVCFVGAAVWMVFDALAWVWRWVAG